MTISTLSTDRDRTLMLLKIERIQYCEQMALLGYKEEIATPLRRGRLVKRKRISLRSDTTQPAFPLMH
jgi:hypothetical protein